MMRLFYNTLLFALFFFRITLHSNGQVPYLLSHLDNTRGLSNNHVRDVFQDSDRLLWISTSDGLNVYNGSSFQLFKSYDLTSSFSLPDNVIIKVNEDKGKQIWICTEKGVTRYNKDDGSLHHYFYYVGQKKHPGSADYFLSVNRAGLVIAGLRLDSIIYLYDKTRDNFIPAKFDVPTIGMIAEVEFDDVGRLWTLSKGGTIRVFVKQGAIFHQIYSFNEPSGIHLFYMTNHRVFFVNGYRDFKEITNLRVHPLIHLPRLINAISYFEGHYYVAYINKGLQELDSLFKPVQNLLKYYPELNDVEIKSILSTGHNILWLSTSEHGLYKIINNQNNFGTVNYVSSTNLRATSITTFAQVNNELWAGTLGDGIIRYKHIDSTKISSTIVNPVNAFYDPSFNQYYTIQKGYDNNVYIGSDAWGVTIYDPQRNKFTPWLKVKGAIFNTDFFRVVSILTCKDSSIFLGYVHGFVHLKVVKDRSGNFSLSYFHEYANDTRFLKLGNNSVSSLVQKGNLVLLGYQFGGLVLLDTTSNRSINILHQNYQGSLSSNNITSLFVDDKGYLWVGTDFGLNRIKFDRLFDKNPQFQGINVENGLPDNLIHGIIEDDEHAIWVSTNKGLAKINSNKFKVVQYRVQDGLQNDEFNDGAIYKDNSGNLYFGGISGFNHFNPKKISADKNLPNLLISDLNFGDQITSGIRLMVIKPDQSTEEKRYAVKPNQNFFHLKIEPANGFSNAKFQYKYILQGYDKRWHELNENSRIEYSNLPAGEYDFYVKWSNGEGSWTGEKTVFHLLIREYFWLTTFAKVLYAIVLLAVGYTIFRIRRSRIDDKNKLFVQNLIRENEQKLYQDKVNFFTNITHELQTPLTLILGSIERYIYHGAQTKKDSSWKFIKIANQEAFRLQYLVHQLLEFRKAESGHSKVVYNYFNISNLIKNIAELFGPLRDQMAINFMLSVEDHILIISDKDKIEKIIFNLISNAFKHSTTNESIICKAEIFNSDNIKIEISNSGFVLGNIELSALFEQFYTVDHNKNTKESSGIGLALTKQLTEILGGTIEVAAANGWITFTLTLPLNLKKLTTEENNDKMLSDKPSYLVRSIAETMEVSENAISKNNDLALMENLDVPGKKSVLIVEDDANIRLLLNEILQEKYVIYEAENGKNAIEVLKKISPNLILSDIVMSDMDGLTLCSTVKSSISTCHIPFLLLSARNSAEEKLEGFEAGADGYLSKPYSPSSLLKKITELIDYRENVLNYFNKDKYYNNFNHSGLKVEDQSFLNQVIKVISENLGNSELDAAQLESGLSLSRMSLYRKLMALTNMSPSEFIKNYRLRQAAVLLKSTNLTVSEIYYQTGFNNQSYFYREFKKLFQSSPKEYRDLIK